MSEFELKLRVPPGQVNSLRAAFLAHGAQPQHLQARYFDTEGGLLAQHAIALRLRLEDGHWVQTLKTAGDGVVHRQEHEVAVDGSADAVPALDPGLHAGSDAGRQLRAALAGAPGAHLMERQATDILRLRVMLQTACGTLVEAALDIGQVRVGARSAPVVEVEIEHKGGPLQGVFDLAADWVRHGGLWLSTLTKAERGERLMDAALLPPRRRPAAAPGVRPGLDGPALMQRVLMAVMEPLLAHAGDLADGDTRAGTLHQVRIGLRKLRTVLRDLAPLAPGADEAWDATLARAAATLGLRRDHEAASAAVLPLLQAAGAPLMTWPAPSGALDPGDAIRERELQLALVAVLALAHAQDDRLAALTSEQARDVVVRRLDQLRRRITHAAQQFEALPLATQHRTRKQLKRQRYLLELTVGLWPAKPARQALKRLRTAQDALGRHNDVAVAMDAFRAHAHADPRAWFAAGFLQATLSSTAAEAARRLRPLRKPAPCWR